MKLLRGRLAWGLVFFTALVLRVYRLGAKPIHFDEGVNGWFVGHMWDVGHYPYSPENFHGPLYFYILQFFETVFGMGLEPMRLSSVCASMGVLFLLYRMRSLVGHKMIVAGILFASSPGIVFYSRTAIHEMTFVFFQCLSVYGFLRWRCHRQRKGVSLFVSGVTGCLLLKETSVIFFGVFTIAWFLARNYPIWIEKISISSKFQLKNDERPYRVKRSEVMFYLAAAASFVALFYSAFLRRPEGVVDFFQSFAPWLREGVDSGHSKPWFYYGQILLKYESLVLLALVGSVYSMLKSDLKMRFFALLGVGQFLAYTIIPYKTPWLVLSFLWPLMIYGGYLCGDFISLFRVRSSAIAKSSNTRRGSKAKTMAGAFSALVGILLVSDIIQSLHLNFRSYTNEKEAYVYVQTKKQFSWMWDYFKSLEQRDSQLKTIKVRAFTEDIWPLPYIFRTWTDVGLHDVEDMPDKNFGSILFVEKKSLINVVRRLQDNYWSHVIDVRNGREKVVLLVKNDPRLLPLPESKHWRRVGSTVEVGSDRENEGQ